MNSLLVVCVFLVSFVVSEPIAEQPDERDSKFFGIFGKIQFENSECGGNATGVCYTPAECALLGGKAEATCAQGFGVCCKFSSGCGGKNNKLNVTYFESSEFKGVDTCTYTVTKSAPNICQIRLDFDEFSLAAPTAAGDCNTDKFMVTGASGVPQICGNAAGQHFYIHLGEEDGERIKLRITGSEKNENRKFSIKISQIECSSPTKAPPGCGQYYADESHDIKSFNYPSSTTATPSQLVNQDYSICIRQADSMCSIKYVVCKDSAGFSLVKTAATKEAIVDVYVQKTPVIRPRIDYTTGYCGTSDYLRIPCMTSSSTKPAGCYTDLVCGTVFNAGDRDGAAVPNVDANIYSHVTPFVLQYHTDADETTDLVNAVGTLTTATDTNNVGFCLKYQQQPC